MTPVAVPHASRWAKRCGHPVLPVRDGMAPDGQPVMTTAWRPSREDLLALLAGAAIEVEIHGTVHPPIRLSVGPVPEVAP